MCTYDDDVYYTLFVQTWLVFFNPFVAVMNYMNSLLLVIHLKKNQNTGTCVHD